MVAHLLEILGHWCKAGFMPNGMEGLRIGVIYKDWSVWLRVLSTFGIKFIVATNRRTISSFTFSSLGIGVSVCRKPTTAVALGRECFSYAGRSNLLQGIALLAGFRLGPYLV